MAQKKKSEFISITVQLRRPDIEKVDEWAKRIGVSRSSLLRILIEDRKNAEESNK